jgi:hypothetical protein
MSQQEINSTYYTGSYSKANHIAEGHRMSLDLRHSKKKSPRLSKKPRKRSKVNKSTVINMPDILEDPKRKN